MKSLRARRSPSRSNLHRNEVDWGVKAADNAVRAQPPLASAIRVAKGRGSARSHAAALCPHDCPCELPKQGLQSQQEPSRLIGEAKEREGFTRKNEDGREADFRLANHRLQPLGHLTATGFLSIYDVAGYASRGIREFVPEIVPVTHRIRLGKSRDLRPLHAAEKAAVSFCIKHPGKRLRIESLRG